MRDMLLRWLLSAVGLYAVIGAARLILPAGSIEVANPWGPFLVIVFLGLINAIIRPIIKLFTLPLNCLTFGLFGTIVNLILFYLAFRIAPGLEIEWSVITFLVLYLGMVAVSIVVNQVVKKGD